MSLLHRLLYITLILPLIVAATACSDDTVDMPDTPVVPTEVVYYLQLSVSTSGNHSLSRTTADSEDGDGREDGLLNEDKIYDLTIFVYRDYGDGLDGNSAFVWKYYVSADEFNYAESSKDFIFDIKIPLTKTDLEMLSHPGSVRLRAAVVANAGDLTDSFSNLDNLRREANVGPSCTQFDISSGSVTTADRFVMSSAFNGAKRTDSYQRDGWLIPYSSGEIIYSCHVTLERLAARIDLAYDSSVVTRNENDGTLTYGVKNTGHTVTLLNILPVNVMQQNSYLLKRVSERNPASLSTSSPYYIAADETRGTDGLPDCYVYTPTFFDLLNPGNLTGTLGSTRLGGWFGATGMIKISADIADAASPGGQGLDSYFSGHCEMNSFGTPFQVDGNNVLTITYANENTIPAEAQDIRMVGSDTVRPAQYLTGLHFRAQYHPDRIYTSGAYSDEWWFTEYRDYVDDEDFWLCRELVNPTETKNIYFDTKDHCREYMNRFPDKTFVNEPILYEGGKCYYNVWLRHNIIDGTNVNYPMMYGIVRNNIYRLSLAFSNIGNPYPDFNDLDYSIECIVDVIPYTVVDLEPEFGLKPKETN